MMASLSKEERAALYKKRPSVEYHAHFAGRLPAGMPQPVTIAKNGVRHIRLVPSTTTPSSDETSATSTTNNSTTNENELTEVLSVGLACSECFSGPRLARLLRPGFDYEQEVLQAMLAGKFASPLSIHTSAGVPAALDDFLRALEPHLPWAWNKKTNKKRLIIDQIDKFDDDAQHVEEEKKEMEMDEHCHHSYHCQEQESIFEIETDENNHNTDWCVSLQMEGASAVWAAVDMLLQVSNLESHRADGAGSGRRQMVAVGAHSYHGPPSTSLGSKAPLWERDFQLKYPVPVVGQEFDPDELLADFEDFLDQHGENIGVLIVEPQWGSSQAGLVWPKDLLKQYICKARSRGIKILSDEIMCGLGRHGQGSLFLSDAWDLDPDAVTFGKAISGGVFPLAGAVLKEGCKALQAAGRTVLQSHTFAGSSIRALMTASQVLKELPQWLPSISKLGEEMKHIFRYLSNISQGMLVSQGQGLMWGCLFSRDVGLHEHGEEARLGTIQCFKESCQEVGVLPYFIPVGGFMVTPVIDIDVGTIYEIGEKLEEAVKITMKKRNWSSFLSHDKTTCITTAPISSTSPLMKVSLSTEQQHTAPSTIIASRAICSAHLHITKTCTSCTSFVCDNVRMRFVSL